jgi:hypothetical protein
MHEKARTISLAAANEVREAVSNAGVRTVDAAVEIAVKASNQAISAAKKAAREADDSTELAARAIAGQSSDNGMRRLAALDMILDATRTI